VRRLAGLIFLAVAFVAGAYLRAPAGGLVNAIFPQIPEQYAETVGYSVAFSALLIAFNVFSGVILSRVVATGMARRTDQLLGVVFGGIEAVLILSAGIVILHTYTDPTVGLSAFTDLGVLRDLRDAIDGSTIGKLLEDTTVPLVLIVLGPFLPKDISTVVPMAIPGGLPGFPIPGLPFPSFPVPSPR
jgi:uncharacterized membrane protein required for colicin V production